MNRKKRVWIAAAVAVFLTAASSAFAQNTPAPGGNTGPTFVQGFSLERMLRDLSIFLPADKANQFQMQGRGGTLQGGSPSPIPVMREPRLFFTAAQIDALLPILQALYRSPFPTPSQVWKLEATVDGILTLAQKAARDMYRKNLPDDMRQRTQQRMQQEGSAMTNLTPLQRRQQLIENFAKMLADRKKELQR